jgi:hypothetical protein
MRCSSAWPFVLGWLLAGLACGCSGRPATFPASGSVSVAGKPAKGALVTLIPKEDAQSSVNAYPRGEVADDGTFVLSTFGTGDGAPEGEYVVTLRWPGEAKAPKSLQKPSAGDDDGPIDKLHGRYLDPKTSPWTVTIRSGTNQIPPIVIPQ